MRSGRPDLRRAFGSANIDRNGQVGRKERDQRLSKEELLVNAQDEPRWS